VVELKSEGERARRVVAVPDTLGDRADLLVHALAQLPDTVRVELTAGERDGRLKALARAYGVSHRLGLGADTDQAGTSATVRARSPGHRVELDWTVESPTDGQSPVRSMADLVEALYEPEDPAAACREEDHLLSGHRIAVVTNLPTHYRVPLFNGVAQRVQAAGGEFRVLFTTGDPRSVRPWLRHESIDFDHRFLRPGPTRYGTKAPVDLGRELRGFEPSLIVSGGFSPLVSGRGLAFARRRGIPFGLWSGDTHLQAGGRGQLRLRERRWIARRASFAISYGWLSTEYLRALNPGLPAVIARNTAPFLSELGDRPGDSPVEFLAVSRAIKGKGLAMLVEAFRDLKPGTARLTLVGAGPELTRLKSAAGGSAQIRFLGAVDTDRVLDCYREAAAFLFPSQIDVFGLVLVEAMGSGLATVTAGAPGAVGDLCVNGGNSIVVGGNDPGTWRRAVEQLAWDSTLRDRLARNGRDTIGRRWTMRHSVDAFTAGLRLGANCGEDARVLSGSLCSA
jgi:glycosyltransferase involved in cell wall biosynthesis